MLDRYIIIFILFSKLAIAEITCPKVVNSLTNDNMNSILALAPNFCISKYQNFEFEDGVDGYCNCQLEKKWDNVPVKEFVSKDQKLKEVGDAFLYELLSVSQVISEISNEFTQEDLENLGVEYPDKCNLPDFLSEKNLSCNGVRLPDEYIEKVFGSLSNNIPDVLKHEFGVKENDKFSLKNLSTKIQNTIEILNGDKAASGQTQKCLPPKFNKAVYNSSSVSLYSVIPQTVNEFDPSLINSDILNKFHNDDVVVKKKLVSKAFSIIEGRCIAVKKNLNQLICKTPEKLKLPVTNSNIEASLINLDTDSSKIDLVTVGRLKSACMEKNKMPLDSENLNVQIIKKIVPKLENNNMSAQSNLEISLKGFVNFTDGFSEANLCKDICQTSGAYPKSGCDFKKLSEIEEKFCTGGVESFSQEQSMICSFVEVEKLNQSKEEIVKSLAHLTDDEVKSYIETNFEGKKKKSIASMIKVDRTSKNENSIKNLFFKNRDEKLVPKIAQAVAQNLEVEQSKEIVDQKISGRKEIKKISSINDEVTTSPSVVVVAKVPAKIVAEATPFTMSSAGTNRSFETANVFSSKPHTKSKSNLDYKKSHEMISERLNETQRLSDLADRISNSQKRVYTMMNKLSQSQDSKPIESEGRIRNSPNYRNVASRNQDLRPSSQIYTNSDGGTGAQSVNTQEEVKSQRGSVVATDLVGRSVTGVSATDERSTSAQGALKQYSSGKGELSSISKLFMGELDKRSVSTTSSNISQLQRVLIPNQLDKVDLVALLKNKDEIKPGEPFILYEIERGEKVEVTLVPTFSEFANKKSFTGYRPINVNRVNQYLVDKIRAHKNLIRDY